MKFYDTVDITIQSWKGGDGVIAGRREKYEAFGWPSGGDGWRWGSIIFEASEHEYTLMPFRLTKKYAAKNGEPGQTQEKYGKRADDLLLRVPVGTVIKDHQTGNILAYLKSAGETYHAAKWWKGWMGNMHFKNPKNQYPQIALAGEPGQKKAITLELLLLGDVALIGAPSVGKSTLINSISSVKAKTGDYPFTTLIPNIWVVTHKWESFTVVDVPGLIEWAHSGKGLWNAFLRHILKARIFALLVDCSRDFEGLSEISMLIDEIRAYIDMRYAPDVVNHTITLSEWSLWYTITNAAWEILLKKSILVVVSKRDELEDEELRQMYLGELTKTLGAYLKKWFWLNVTHDELKSNILSLSSFQRESLEPFLTTCITLLTTYKYVFEQEIEQIMIDTPIAPYVKNVTETELQYLLDQGYIKDSEAKYIAVREVREPEICYLTYVLPRWNYEAELRYRWTLAKEKHINRLEKHGARKWDILKIISLYEGQPDKYILRD